MIPAQLPNNESRRLRILEEYKIVDSENEIDFDDITKLASEICECPISLISLVDYDRQWFKSAHGLSIKETPRTLSFCAHAINDNSIFVVEDARLDERFHDSPLVIDDPNIVFYAGIPLIDDGGYALGTLCVIDNKTKQLSQFQQSALKTLGRQVLKLIELKKTNYKLNEKNLLLEENYKELERFSHVVSHDIKSPLNNILSFTELLSDERCQINNPEAILYIELIKESSEKLKEYIDASLNSFRNNTIASGEKQFFYINSVLKTCIELLNPKNEYEINLPENLEIYNYKKLFEEILLNLISNAIKYNYKPKVIIDINSKIEGRFFYLSIKDNGIGIENDKLEQIFEKFKTLDKTDRFNNSGTGIGLSNVKTLLYKIDGEISVKSILGIETIFTLKLKL